MLQAGKNKGNYMQQILENKVLIATFLGWFVAQAIKTLVEFIKAGEVDFSRMIGSGGMPSSHSSLVTSLTTAIGLTEGFNSSLFALSFGIACIVMYDASGVRLAVGKQAKILNQILEDAQKHKFEAERLKELIGHTPIQVYAGGILGILIALIYLKF